MRYFTTDHLGSVAVITDELGAVVERLSFDAWGKRRHADGTDDPSGSITSQTSRGLTGHEMIDEVGLVNMNGRVYDPEIGRFMSADPFVQDPTNTQSLNRYSYVGNNPLSYTDPSGYFSLGKFLKTLIAIVVAVVAAIYGQGWVASAIYGSGTAGAAACAAACATIAGAIGGAIAGGITGGNLRSVVTGAISGAVFARLGFAAKAGAWTDSQRFVAFGLTGGVSSVAQGGNFQSGFLAAGFSALAQPYIDVVANDNVFVGAAASAVVGGTASVLGGGKFVNGAVTGAFSYAAGRAIDAGGGAGDKRDKAKGKLASSSMSDAVNDPTAQAAASHHNADWQQVEPSDGLFGGKWKFVGGRSIKIEVQNPNTFVFEGFEGGYSVHPLDVDGKVLPVVRVPGSTFIGSHTLPNTTWSGIYTAPFDSPSGQYLWTVSLGTPMNIVAENSLKSFYRVYRSNQ
jgi:RHS repeat-associated protein